MHSASRSIHEATLVSAQRFLALTPVFLLFSTLCALTIGIYAVCRFGEQETFYKQDKERMEQRDELKFANRMRKARGFAELSAVFGVEHEEHVVTTPDGYRLMLHRIILPKAYRRHGRHKKVRGKRPVVLLQHGLCTNSAFFMAVSDPKRCLPLQLLENGYDVWLGNNRGNMYSQRHTTLSSSSPAYWDFCIDDLASSDVPSFVSYILSRTGQPKLSYIGFSQGSAQCFAALSKNKELNDKLEVFVALAPIMRPRGYASTTIDQYLKWRPSLLYTLFGSVGLFPIVSRLQRLLPAFMLHACVDIAVFHLLGYQNRGISKVQKLASYPHLFCPSSVKSVVHWTQIMIQGELAPFQSENMASVLERYPTESITTPIVLIHGDKDSLFEPELALARLPCGSSGVRRFELKNYEHIDIVWGRNVHIDVIPRVVEVLP